MVLRVRDRAVQQFVTPLRAYYDGADGKPGKWESLSGLVIA
jgi:hypothetical protein